jgi:hypothetical protein
MQKIPFWNICIRNIYAIYIIKRPRNLKIAVCTIHNYGGTVCGRDKIVEVSRTFEHRYCEKKISKRDFFATPFISTFEVKTN